MRNSGKIASGAALAALALMVMTIFTLGEPVLMALVGAVALVFVASVWGVLAQHRYLAMLLGGVGTTLTIAFSIAFLRTWGLAFNQDAAALGAGAANRDPDSYFYLAVMTGLLTQVFLFAAAVWPARKVRQQQKLQRPKARSLPTRDLPTRKSEAKRPNARKPAPPKPASRSTTIKAGGRKTTSSRSR